MTERKTERASERAREEVTEAAVMTFKRHENKSGRDFLRRGHMTDGGVDADGR